MTYPQGPDRYGPPHQYPPHQQRPPHQHWPPQPAVAPRNGFGITALALGIVGLVLCLVPLTGFIGLILGLLAFLFAALGLGRVRRGQATNRGVTVAGLVLAVLAVVGGFFSMKVFFDIVGNLGGSSSPPAAVSGPAPAGNGAQTGSGSEFVVGQTVDRDGLQLTAAALTKDRSFGQRVLCSMVTYKNTAAEEHSFNTLDWKIQSPDGVQSTTWPTEKKALSSGQLAPGGTVSGNVCIKDPGVPGDYLIINEALFADAVRWKASA